MLLTQCWLNSSVLTNSTRAERVTALLGLSGIFGHDLAENADFVETVIAMYQQLCELGARECVAALSADA